MQLRDRYIQLAAARIFQMQQLGFAFAQIHRDQAQVAADPVLAVHHRIVDFQFRQVAHHRVDIASLFLAAPLAALDEPTVQLGFGDDRELFARQRETVGDACNPQGERRRRGGEILERLAGVGLQCMVVQPLQDGFAAPGRFGDEQHLVGGAPEKAAQGFGRIVGMAIDGEVGQGHRPTAGRDRGQGHACERLGQRKEVLVAEKQALRFEDGAFAVGREKVVALPRVGGKTADRGVEVAVQDQLGACGQIVKQRRRLVEEERQIVFDTGGRHAVADVLVHRGAARIAFEGLAPAAARGAACGFVERKFAAGQQADFWYRVEAALGIRVEGADGFDLIVEQIDPVGQRRAHRKQVDQPAAHAIFAGAHHLTDVFVAGQGQLGLELGLIELVALRERKRIGGHIGGRRHPVQRGGGGHQQDVAAAFAEVVQGGQALGHQVLVRREGVVGQGFPVGQQAHAGLGREISEFVLQPLGIRRIGADHGQHRHLIPIGCEIAGDQQRIGGAVRAVEGKALRRLDERERQGGSRLDCGTAGAEF